METRENYCERRAGLSFKSRILFEDMITELWPQLDSGLHCRGPGLPVELICAGSTALVGF